MPVAKTTAPQEILNGWQRPEATIKRERGAATVFITRSWPKTAVLTVAEVSTSHIKILKEKIP